MHHLSASVHHLSLPLPLPRAPASLHRAASLRRRLGTLLGLRSTDPRGQDLETAKYKAGFEKIEATCRLARKQNIDYAWIDTCCIDRTSSADLTEAINATFRIYEASSVCFVYLADLPSLPHLPPSSQAPPYTASRGLDRETTGVCEPQGFAQVPPLLGRCRWFTRGWSLQELIAPKRVEFHDRFWYFRGSKSLWIKPLAEITGIHPRALASRRNLAEHSVAARFSWAAQRQTTRVEDTAYCLMGIFGVHMPVIYGEHENAFIRLQEEICKKSNDLSLFAWTAQPRDDPQDSLRGLFATTPAEFGELVFGTVPPAAWYACRPHTHGTTSFRRRTRDCASMRPSCRAAPASTTT